MKSPIRPSEGRIDSTRNDFNSCAPLYTLLVVAMMALGADQTHAGIAYGTINNFDTVNDTGGETHGFEIELDDIESADITYTYDWNHYGTPSITEDTSSNPGHTNVIIRYAAVLTNGVWSAYTAVPSGPIAPTQGHQFTNPSLNFGGEHFGVGYRRPASVVKYNWLIANNGSLVLGPSVNVATPTFTYVPPVGGGAAQVQAVIVPPPPPVLPSTEFGSAEWVKEIRTTTHNNNEVKLRDLVSKDPDYPNVKDWRNGEPDEVEVEWQVLQIDYMSGNGGANGQLQGAPENLNNGDEVVTRRYEFYEYLGPLDPETGEALAQNVAADGIHGKNSYANTIIVGKFLGAQMSAFDANPPIGLIDHLPDGEVDIPYATRSVVIATTTNFTVTTDGALPDGMAFDPATSQVYGTPWVSGVFTFHVTVTVTNTPALSKTYLFTIAKSGEILPPHSDIDTSETPLKSGTTTSGVFDNGTTATVVATPANGYAFAGWWDNGTLASTSATYEFTAALNRSLVAKFVPVPPIFLRPSLPGVISLQWPTNFTGFVIQANADLASTNWVNATNPVITSGSNYQALIQTTNRAQYFRLQHP